MNITFDLDRSQVDDSRLTFEAEFKQIQRNAFLLARRLGCSPEEALDAVQDAAERAWRYRAKRKGQFRPWFLAIVYRTATKHRWRELPLPPMWLTPPPPELVSEHDPDLLAALGRLPSGQRAALWLRYCEDLSTADVASVLRITEVAAKQLLLRARRALRKEIEKNA
jgi:RNA polymerase sigma-70 factor (ECF subfamily)